MSGMSQGAVEAFATVGCVIAAGGGGADPASRSGSGCKQISPDRDTGPSLGGVGAGVRTPPICREVDTKLIQARRCPILPAYLQSLYAKGG